MVIPRREQNAVNKAKGSGGDDEGGSADSLAREAAAAKVRKRW